MAFTDRRAEGGESFFNLGALVADVAHASAELVFGPVGIGHQIEQPILLLAEGLELAAHLSVQLLVDAVVLSLGAGQPFAHLGPVLVVEPDRGVVRFYGSLDIDHAHVGQVAAAVYPSPAGVVEVLVTVLAAARHDDQPFAAAVAPDDTLEVVIVRSVACACSALLEEHALHPVEQVLGDQRLVPTFVLLTVPFDIAEVVAILQQLPDLVDGDRPGAEASVALGEQSGFGEGVAQGVEVVLARGVQLEGQEYEL